MTERQPHVHGTAAERGRPLAGYVGAGGVYAAVLGSFAGAPAELADEVRGHGARHAVGELFTGPFCLAMWTQQSVESDG